MTDTFNDDSSRAMGDEPQKKKRLKSHASRVRMLREAIVVAIKPAEMVILLQQLMGMAQEGDLAAAKLVFDYTVGKPVEADLLARIDQLEAVVEQSERGY